MKKNKSGSRSVLNSKSEKVFLTIFGRNLNKVKEGVTQRARNKSFQSKNIPKAG